MISIIDTAVCEAIAKKLSDYGMDISFTYDERLDILSEFRRSAQLRVDSHDFFSQMVQDVSSNVSTSMGLFSRSPVKRSDLLTNNLRRLEMSYNSEGGRAFRKAFLSEIDYSFKIVFTNHSTSDIFESVYACDLDGATISIPIDIIDSDSGKKSTEISIKLSSLSNIFKEGGSDLRVVEFSTTVTSMMYLPYVRTMASIDCVELTVFFAFKEEDYDYDSIDEGDIVYRRIYKIDENSQVSPVDETIPFGD